MDLKPFVQLAKPRVVNHPELPPDLAEFYANNEGVGLEGSEDLELRLCRLEEISRIGWKDLRAGLADPVPEGWEKFAGFRIGAGEFFAEIVYVLSAPSCPSGAILDICEVAPGPGGKGPDSLETTLVLAASLRDWLTHLERWGWVEYAVSGGVLNLPKREQKELLQYYLTLNPNMNVG